MSCRPATCDRGVGPAGWGRTTTVPIPVIVDCDPGTDDAVAILLALASPELRVLDQIVLMSGAWAEGNVTPAAEFNAWSDPESLTVLLQCGRPVVFATLELTAQALVTPSRLAAWRALGKGRCLATACDIQATVPPSLRLGGSPLHDPCAVAWLIRPDLFTTRSCSIRIDLGPGPSRGRTLNVSVRLQAQLRCLTVSFRQRCADRAAAECQ
jgi:purine nucleosidase